MDSLLESVCRKLLNPPPRRGQSYPRIALFSLTSKEVLVACKDVSSFTEISYLLHWSFVAGKEILIVDDDVPKRIFCDPLLQILQEFETAIYRFLSDNISSRERVILTQRFNPQFLMFILGEYHSILENGNFDSEMDQILQEALAVILSLIVTLSSFNTNLPRILLMFMKIFELRSRESTPLSECWKLLFSRVRQLKEILSLLNKASQGQCSQRIFCEYFMYFISFGLKGFREDSENVIDQIFYRVVSRKAIKILLNNFSPNSRRSLLIKQQQKIAPLLLSYIESHQFKKPIEFLNYYFAILGNQISLTECFSTSFLPRLIVRDEFQLIPQVVHNLSSNIVSRMLKLSFFDVLQYLFLECNADAGVIIECVNKLEALCSVKINDFFRERNNVTHFVASIMSRFHTNTESAIRALSFVNFITIKDIGTLVDQNMKMFMNKIKFQIYLSKHMWLFIEKFDEKCSHSIIFPLLKMLNFIERKEFFAENTIEFLFMIRSLADPGYNAASKEKRAMYCFHCLKLFIKNVPLAHLKILTPQLISITLLLVKCSRDYMEETVKLLLTIDQGMSTEIVNNLYFLPYTGNIKVMIDNHIKRNSYDFNPLQSLAGGCASDMANFAKPCKLMVHLALDFEHPEQVVHETALLKFMHLWEENKNTFDLYTAYQHRKMFLDQKTLFTFKYPFEPDFKLERYWKFFRFALLQIMKCIKFGDNRSRILAGNLIGCIGSVYPQTLYLDEPFQKELYKKTPPIEFYPDQLDFANTSVFRHQSRDFKRLLMRLIFARLRSFSKGVYFLEAVESLQKLNSFFQTKKQVNQIFGHGFEPFQSDGVLPATPVMEYIRTLSSKEQNTEKMMFVLKAVLDNERNYYFENARSFSPFENELLKKLYPQMRRLKKCSAMSIHDFFVSIQPTTSYKNFILGFVRMLYREYFFDIQRRAAQPDTDSDSQPRKSSGLIFSSMFTQAFSQHSKRLNMKAELEEIQVKLKALETPAEIFDACYGLAVRDIELAHLILPSLLIYCLSNISDAKQEEFGQYFVQMVKNKFIDNIDMFFAELGKMGAQLLCFLFDFIQNFLTNRRHVHSLIISDEYLRKKAVKLDPAYAGLSKIIDNLEYLDFCRLCVRSKNYARSLYYFEKSIEEKRLKISGLSDDFNNFPESDRLLLLEIYYGLDEKHSLYGIERHLKNFPGMLEKFYFSLNNNEKSMQQVIAKNLLYNPEVPPFHRHTIQEFCARNLCTSYPDLASFSKNVFEEMSKPSENSGVWSPNVPQLICEAALDLNCWDIVENAFSHKELDHLTRSNLSEVFKSIYQGETIESLKSQLDQARKFYIEPLNAELLNSHYNAYHQCYGTTITSLHSLSDIQLFVENVYKNFNDSSNPDLTSLFEDYDTLALHWRSRNQQVPNVCGFGTSRKDIKQQIIRVQMIILNVFKILIERKYQMTTVYESFFAKHVFLLHSDLMRAYLEQDDTIQAYNHLITAYAARNKFYMLNSVNSKEIHDPETNFIIDASIVLFERNDKEGAMNLINREFEERYSDLVKRLSSEVFRGMEEKREFFIINEISLEQNIQLTNRVSSFCNLYMTNSKDVDRSLLASNLDIIKKEREEFVEQMNLIDMDSFKNFELLQLQYMALAEETDSFGISSMVFSAERISVVIKDSAKVSFHVGLYLWRHILKEEELKHNKTGKNVVSFTPAFIFDLKVKIAKSLISTLMISSRNFQICVPIILDVYLDMAMVKTEDKKLKEFFRNTCQELKQLSEGPNVVFLNYVEYFASFLLSKNVEVIQTSKIVLKNLIRDFPHHMAWQLDRLNDVRYRANVNVSQLFSEAQRCRNSENLNEVNTEELFGQFHKIVELLAEFSSMSTDQTRKAGKVEHLLSKSAQKLWFQFSKINQDISFILPFTSFLNVGLYNLDKLYDIDHFNHYITVKLIDEFSVMSSIQRPKKISFQCQDGVVRSILLKCGDDLRKDRLFLDFANIFIQAYDQKLSAISPMKMYAPFGRQQHNSNALRSYTALAMSRNFGIIEWVPNLRSFSYIITNEMNACGRLASFKKNQKNFETKTRRPGILKRIEAYEEMMKLSKPPVFQNWFINNFANSHSWFTARRNFTRSSAIYSGLGFMMGLGDRHCDNISIDPFTGYTVHIDFNCLFNHGEDFQVPELVPFRLTHNMQAAMGITKHDGDFREYLKSTITVIREHRNLMLIHFTPLLCDPFHEWILSASDSRVKFNALISQNFNGVKARIIGLCKRMNGSYYGLPSSPTAQTNYLINQAIDEKNLSLMYFGWRAYN